MIFLILYNLYRLILVAMSFYCTQNNQPFSDTKHTHISFYEMKKYIQLKNTRFMLDICMEYSPGRCDICHYALVQLNWSDFILIVFGQEGQSFTYLTENISFIVIYNMDDLKSFNSVKDKNTHL